jgi:hypothetical protein
MACTGPPKNRAAGDAHVVRPPSRSRGSAARAQRSTRRIVRVSVANMSVSSCKKIPSSVHVEQPSEFECWVAIRRVPVQVILARRPGRYGLNASHTQGSRSEQKFLTN